MFKRSVISDEISQDIIRAVEVTASFGLEGIELRSVFGKNLHELSKAERIKIYDAVKAKNMVIPCLSTPIFKCQIYDEEEFRENIYILEKSIKIAKEWQTNMIRGFTFWQNGIFQKLIPTILEKIRSIIPILEENKIIMIIESDPNTNANSTQKLKILLDNINSQWVRAIWDPGNNLYVKEAEKPFPDSYETLKKYIAHIHVKDVIRYSQDHVDSCCIGNGEVNWSQIIDRLVVDNYTGFLSLETHYRLNKKIPQHLLDLPKGYAFSCFGEEASIESLKSWNKIIKNIGFSK